MSEPFENVCLTWSDFQQNISSCFQKLRTSPEFTDVTLVCEDGHRIEAHKIVLAACSQFFRTVIKGNKHPHPIIYMRGLKTRDLVAIVDFIYYGEANIHQEDLEKFLALGEELQLKGLADNRNESSSMGIQPPIQEFTDEDIQVKEEPNEGFENNFIDPINGGISVVKEEFKVKDIAAKIDAMINEKRKQAGLSQSGGEGKQETTGLKCDVCDITCSTIYNLKAHRMRHNRVKSISCRSCLVHFKDIDVLRNHRLKCRLYICKCGIKAESSSLIKSHRETCCS